MKQSSLTIFFAALMTALFSACSDDFGSKEIPQEELYTRAFIKEFGIFDANHTWCAATPTSITVNPQSLLSDVRVYSRTDGKYYYVAHYTDVYKSTTITFDAPRGTTDLKLIIDGTTYYAQAGTTLSVSGRSRTIYDKNKDDATADIRFWATSDYLELDCEDMISYRETLPESGGSATENNLGKVTQNFYFLSTGEFTVYPVYWQTSQTNTVGIYTRPANATTTDDFKYYPFYKADQASDALQYRKEGWYAFPIEYCKTIVDKEFSEYTTENWNTLKDALVEWAEDNCYTLFGDNNIGLGSLDTIEEPGKWTSSSTINLNHTYYDSSQYTNVTKNIDSSTSLRVRFISDWTNAPKGSNGSYPTKTIDGNTVVDPAIIGWRTKGITIKIQDGVQFGMYLDTNYNSATDTDGNITYTHGYMLHSEAEFNEQVGDSSVGGNINLCHAGTYLYASTLCPENQEYDTRVLGFEDWYGQLDSSDPDLNDLILFIRSTDVTYIPSVEDIDDTYEWLICAEDLGTHDDFDFNDMIASVHAFDENGNTTLTIKARAAGGTLPIYLCFDHTKLVNPDDDDIEPSTNILHPTLKTGESASNCKEFHKWFGNYSSSTMINTGSDANNCSGRKCVIHVNGSFTLNSQYVDPTVASLANFYILVDDDTESRVIGPSISTTEVKAPQMFVVPDHWPEGATETSNGTTVYYKWPTERTDIQAAYDGSGNDGADPSFADWVGNQVSYDEWYKYPSGEVTWYK